MFSVDLQDVEQSPRFLILSAIVAVSSILSLFSLIKVQAVLKRNLLLYIVILFLVLLLVSFTRSINFGDGLFELLKISLLLCLFFQFAFVLAANETNKLIFFKAICLSALIFIAFGFLQILPELKEGDKLIINYSISSTLGNKNFFSETLALMLPLTALSIILFVSYWRVIAIITTLLIIISIAFLQTMAAWVAVFFTAIIIVVLILKFSSNVFTTSRSHKIFKIAIVIMIILSALSGILVIKLSGANQITSKIRAFHELTTSSVTQHDLLHQNSIYERVWMWRNSVKMIGEYPVFGTGLANWKIYYPKYGLGSAKYMTSDAIRFVHPHNDFFLIACEMGLIGLLVFISIFIVLYYYSWKIVSLSKTQEKFVLGMALFSGLSIYIIISLFSMPLYRFYPPLLIVFFMALIYSEYSSLFKINKTSGKKDLIIIFSISFLIAGYAVFIGYKRLTADYNLSATLLNERKREWSAMQRHLNRIDKNFYPLDVTATPIAWYQGYALFYLGDIEKAHRLFKEAEAVNPYHLKVLNDLGSCYNLKGDPKTAKQYFLKALEIQPAFNDALINLSIIYFNEGKVDSSYSTLIKHKGLVKPESVTVFGTIISAKAQTITSDEETLEWLMNQMRNRNELAKLLNEIKHNQRGINAVLERK